MKIEIKSLKIAASLSEETTAYTADIFVDGVKTFSASNHGHGGCDFYRPYPTAKVTEADVNAWLAVNCPPDGPWEADPAKRAPYDMGTTCNLETFVGRFVAKAEADKETKRIRSGFARTLATKIVELSDGKVFTYKAAPTAANLATMRSRKPGIVLVNDAGDATKETALRAFCPNLDSETDEDLQEAVYARLRENRSTLADAKFLLANEQQSKRPCADTITHLQEIVATGEAAYKAYRDERDAARTAQVA